MEDGQLGNFKRRCSFNYHLKGILLFYLEMKKLCIFLFLSALVISIRAEGNKKKWWDYELDFDRMPSDQIPSWHQVGSGGQAVIEGGKLIITTDGDKQSMAFSLRENGVWESVTVEFRVRVIESHGQNAAQFNITVNDSTYFIPIKNTEEILYRAVLDNGVMTLYHDGADPIDIKALPAVRNKRYSNELLFGDAGSRVSGVTEWSALRWTWGRAVHP